MYKIWFGLVFAAVITTQAPAQDYHRNWVECAKELGWQVDLSRFADAAISAHRAAPPAVTVRAKVDAP